MSQDTGVIGYGSKEKPSAGRWVSDMKDGRKRTLFVYMADRGENTNDESYLGYYADEANVGVGGCNFAIVLGGDVVRVQTVGKEKDAKVKIREFPLSQFMDMLDAWVLS
jgi:hypothetical protein